jgi:saccharopine dehydrogenase (NADP+, L-glutamate forming)
MKTILVLGAGLVARPLVNYLLQQQDIAVVVADLYLSKAQALIKNHPHGRAVALNAKDEVALENLVIASDLVISLLPFTYHLTVAAHCLGAKKHLITTSYISAGMQALDRPAQERGLLFLNEMGLDPGIDHISAMSVIERVKNSGGKIVAFESCCGGLPAPEANDNPFGYKFSWSPRGVLMAGQNDACYLKNNKKIQVDGKMLFRHRQRKNVQGAGTLEVYPNRNALRYIDLYGLHKAHSFFRGTLRYPGWCETMEKIAALGYLNSDEQPGILGKSYARLTASLIGQESTYELRQKLSSHLGLPRRSEIIDRFEWLGLLSDKKVDADPPTLLDALAALMSEKMSYRGGERDMIILQHDLIADYGSAGEEHICSRLIDYGVPGGDSAMARTVSLPAAIAVELIARGHIDLAGVHLPVLPLIYRPVLVELGELGIRFEETVKVVKSET